MRPSFQKMTETILRSRTWYAGPSILLESFTAAGTKVMRKVQTKAWITRAPRRPVR